MKIKISQKQLIIVHVALFAISFVFLEYSKMFRMNKDLHWIYSWGHTWWILGSLPCAFLGSLILGIYSLWKNKLLYFLFSMTPLILFIILILV